MKQNRAAVFAALLLGALSSAIPGAEHTPIDTSGPMTAAKFARYVQTFNNRDLRFVQFYHPDIVFDKGEREGLLRGREAIANWYREAWSRLNELVSARAVVIDREQNLMMVELRTQLDATADGFQSSRGTLRRGDRFVSNGAVVYTLKDGLITSIRGISKLVYTIPAGSTDLPPAE